ncbi:hypothetical protein BRD17_02010 [Halobacteriales archaeon SW_7_68_16]|nr:MAG: hypothetical protein BRD17_02010 [Halobacteriales archaeon SW_7_68_16]
MGRRSTPTDAGTVVIVPGESPSDAGDSNAGVPDPDGVAGIVDTFGCLDRDELRRGIVEAAYRLDRHPDDEAIDAAIDAAIEEYCLARVDDDPERYVVGPAAFPTVPDGARDLPHVLGIDRRDPDRSPAHDRIAERFRSDAARAVDAGDGERIVALLDLSYEIELWADADLAAARDLLDEAAP